MLGMVEMKRELAPESDTVALDPRKRLRTDVPPPPPPSFIAGIGAKQELEARLDRLVGAGAVPAPPPPVRPLVPRPPAASQVQDPLSLSLFSALQRLGRDKATALDRTGATAGAAGLMAPSAPSQAQDIGAALQNSLKGLLTTGALADAAQSSGTGQHLLHIVQDLTVKKESFPAPVQISVKRERKKREQVKSESVKSETVKEERMGGSLPPRPILIEADVLDAEDQDDAPHRLPANFGAIPEDLIMERAQAREDERVRRIKATQPCRFGRACKKRDCPNMHSEGREIDTMLNLCAFGRRCKRADCFYDHPEGRELDNDPTKGNCRWGKRCKRADCLYMHPEGREPVSGPDLRICFHCHSAGHIASDCPANSDSWAFDANRESEKALADSSAPPTAADAAALSASAPPAAGPAAAPASATAAAPAEAPASAPAATSG